MVALVEKIGFRLFFGKNGAEISPNGVRLALHVLPFGIWDLLKVLFHERGKKDALQFTVRTVLTGKKDLLAHQVDLGNLAFEDIPMHLLLNQEEKFQLLGRTALAIKGDNEREIVCGHKVVENL